jgi:hypothetical protein
MWCIPEFQPCVEQFDTYGGGLENALADAAIVDLVDVKP